MDAERFIEHVGAMRGEDLRWVAGQVRHDALSADDELVWWRATTTVAATLRAARQRRHAARAAHAAVEAVRAAARREGVLPDEPEVVTAVARAAADAARAIVADPVGEAGSVLVAPFQPVLSAAA